MLTNECQREIRAAFLGGFAGQLVSGLIWLVAAAASLWINHRWAMALLFFGSMVIFPLTQSTLHILGRPGKVSPENGLWGLGTQTAFIVPINFLLVGAAVLHNPTWFFPVSMIVVGSHYLPFITLYGMKMFGILAALLVLGGAALALYGPDVFSLGGWITAFTLILFAFVGRRQVLLEENQLI